MPGSSRAPPSGGKMDYFTNLSVELIAMASDHSPGLGHSWAVSGTTAWGRRGSRLGRGRDPLSLGSPRRGRGVRLFWGVHRGVTSSRSLAFSRRGRAGSGSGERRTRAGGRGGISGKSRGRASDSGGHEKLNFPRWQARKSERR